MTATTVSSVINHNNSANFQAWINEIYTALVTTCGLTQTTDTGQDSVPSTAVYTATTTTIVSFYVFRFNDTLQATSPIFIKVEFGTGNSANAPLMYVTVGSSTNGAGTITGLATPRCQLASGQPPSSTIVSYPSRYCYNATQGFCGFCWKIGGYTAGVSLGGFQIARSVNASGAPTADTANCFLQNNTTGAQSYGPILQALNYNQSLVMPTSGQAGSCCFIPYSVINTAEGNTAQVFPFFQYKGNATTPGWGITNALCVACTSEFPVGTTFSSVILGSTSLTYASVGAMCGNTSGLNSILSYPYTSFVGCMLYT